MKAKNYTIIISLFLLVSGMVSAQTPVVTYPNGGETLTVGQTVQITWTGTALGQIVGIDYTTDNWTTVTWLNTNYSNPSANSYTWVVPNTVGSQCMVGIFNTSFQGDISDNFFSIVVSTGIKTETSEKFNVYPNPAHDFINVKSADKPISQIEIFNLVGEKVSGYKVNDTNARLSTENLKDGIYFLNMISADGDVTRQKLQVMNSK